MKKILDELLINLKILSKIKENGKISTKNNRIELESNSKLQWVWRIIYGDSRMKTINFLKKIINNTIDTSNNLMNSTYFHIKKIKKSITEHEEKTHQEYFFILKEIVNELKNSIKGLVNLQQTYLKDAYITSNIDILITSINNQIIIIESNLKKIEMEDSDADSITE